MLSKQLAIISINLQQILRIIKYIICKYIIQLYEIVFLKSLFQKLIKKKFV